MRRTLTSLALVLLTTGLGCNGDGGPSQLHSEFIPNEPVVDFAAVCVGDTAEYTLPVSNGGAAALNITSVTATNPEVEVVSYPERLQAAGLSAARGEIVLHWTPTGDGDMTTDLVVESDDPESPSSVTVVGMGDAGTRVDLRFMCEGTGGVAWDRCPSFLLFKDTAIGATAPVPVQLTNEGCAKLTVTDYYVTDDEGNPLDGPDAPWAVGGPEPGFTFSRGNPEILTPTFQPAVDGSFFGELHVVWEDTGIGAAPVDDRLSLSGTGMELKLLFDPSSFSYSQAEQGNPQQQRFLVRNRGSLDGEITAFEMKNTTAEFTITPPTGDAPWSIPAGAELEFFVTYEPSDVGTDSNTLLVRTDMGDFEVPLVGGAAPRLEIDPPDVLDFGAVATGGSAQQPVVLRNRGNASLSIQEVRFPTNPENLDGSNVFTTGSSLQTPPFTIEPNGEVQFIVTFHDNPNTGWVDAPNANESEWGELAVKSNDPTYAEPPQDSGLKPGETSILLTTNTEANFGPDTVVIVASYKNAQGQTEYCDPALCTVVEGTTVTFSGAQTVDPEGDALHYNWTILQSGSNNLGSATLENGSNLAERRITPDYPGMWKFKLTVNDDYGNTSEGTIEVGVSQP